jgi:hypothetical protein
MKTIKTVQGFAQGRNGSIDIGAIQVDARGYKEVQEIRIDGISKTRGFVLSGDGISFDVNCARELAEELLALCGVKKLPIKIVSLSSERKVCTTENGTETDEIEIWAEAQVLLDKHAFVQTIRSSGTILDRPTATERDREEEDRNQLIELISLLLGMGFSKEDIDSKKDEEIDIDLDKLALDIATGNC